MTRSEKILSNIMQRVHEAQEAWYSSNWNRLGIEPYGMEGDTSITNIPNPQYQTHVQGALPTGGMYGNITPFAREQKLTEQEAEEEKKTPKATAPVPDATEEAGGGDPFAGVPEDPAAAGGGDPAAGAEVPAEGGGDPAAAGGDPFGGAGGDPAAGGMGGGMDPSMGGGMGMGMEPRSAIELGKIYELKKIYTRLASIESYLATEASEDLQKIRGFVAQAIEMFEIIASNLISYKDRMDEIIVIYYKFLLEVYDLVRTYYKSTSPNSGVK